jgi:hypothetical protein
MPDDILKRPFTYPIHMANGKTYRISNGGPNSGDVWAEYTDLPFINLGSSTAASGTPGSAWFTVSEENLDDLIAVLTYYRQKIREYRQRG